MPSAGGSTSGTHQTVMRRDGGGTSGSFPTNLLVTDAAKPPPASQVVRCHMGRSATLSTASPSVSSPTPLTDGDAVLEAQVRDATQQRSRIVSEAPATQAHTDTYHLRQLRQRPRPPRPFQAASGLTC